MPVEGSTEAIQEALQIAQADPSIDAIIGPYGRQRLVSAAVGGAVVGGLFGAAGGALEHEHAAPPIAPAAEEREVEPRGLEADYDCECVRN